MARGTVKWFSDQKGYGFITAEGSEESEVFVHFSAIECQGFKTLHPGETVEFELKHGKQSTVEAAHVFKV
ncbi:MAG: cold-shock protein [Candidatus Eisenbacteria bacterium]|nr:cold-shock protein [Candidatus Eisenbacteria bacterium]